MCLTDVYTLTTATISNGAAYKLNEDAKGSTFQKIVPKRVGLTPLRLS